MAVADLILRLFPGFAWLVVGGLFRASAAHQPIGVAGLLLLGAGLVGAGWLGRGQRRGSLLAGGLLGLVLVPLAGVYALVGVAVTLLFLARELVDQAAATRRLEAERAELARQLDRRINEIFSLQELSYILADSLASERIAERVARYVMRFLNAEGAALALVDEGDGRLRVAAAEGALAGFAGRNVEDVAEALVVRALATERIEVGRRTDAEPVMLLPGFTAESAAAVPLRAHGLAMGVLAVANRRDGGFSAEDLWLLSTVSTQVAVILANSRLFEMVRQAKEEWETAFNALTEGIAVLDKQGRIARGNRALARLLNMPAPALMGRPFWEEVVGSSPDTWLLSAAEAKAHPAPLTVQSAPTGRLLRLTAAPLAEPTYEAALVVLVADVTEQRALEAQLIQSEKLAAVGQLVSGVAHELNNPLTSIAGLSEFLQERPGLGADREHLRVINEQAERAGRIVRNLLTFARRGTAADAVVDLNDVVERTALVVAYELEMRGIRLLEQRAAGPLPVRGSRDELQQVVVNLVTNAIHAVRDQPPELPREITLTTARDGAMAVVRVRDTGKGVSPAHERELFTPFFTTKEPGEGTGLGLSLSYRIVEAHGGRLAYAPAPGRGAEFWFSIPIATDLPEGEAAAAPAAERSALLVDDDPGIELVVRALLEPAGIAVERAASAADGARRLAERRWRLVIVDGGLSADGRQLLSEQAQVPDGTRLVVATADAALAERCRARGAATLPRPFLPRDLISVVGDLLDA